MNRQYETVIGLEIHVELSTATKIFCSCSTAFGKKPNENVCPVCAGMPGTLPVLNRRVPELAAAVSLALHCEINRCSRFDRKNYFYPDNPQNYQISQFYVPIGVNGWVELSAKKIGIHELHMEEDAGKLTHTTDENGKQISLIDYNRAGVPLIEIVTEPDFRSAEEVLEFLEILRLKIQYLRASDCRLQEGSMRVDVNLSVREAGAKQYGTRTEMKNLSSFHSIKAAIAGERARQIAVLEAGGTVEQETRRYDEDKDLSFSMRSKETANDYRYFPDPDLPPVCLSEERIESLKAQQPEFAPQRRARYAEEYGIPAYDAEILTGAIQLAELFEGTVSAGAPPKKVSNWMIGETLRLMKEHRIAPEKITLRPEPFAKLIQMTEQKVISQGVAKEVFEKMFLENADPEQYVEKHKLKSDTDEETVRNVIRGVFSDNPKSVEDYRNGKDRAMGFLVGQSMRALRGKANPELVNRIVLEYLQEI